MAKVEEMRALIKEQTKGKVGTPECGIGFQLMDIVGADEALADIVLTDLKGEVDLGVAAKALADYAGKNCGKQRCFCITPDVAEGILRKLYGLPEAGEPVTAAEPPKKEAGILSLDDFL